MNKPKIWVMLKLADSRTITVRLNEINAYTEKGVRGFAGKYVLPERERRKGRKSEQYVFFTDNYEIQDIDGRKTIGQKEGSTGAVVLLGKNSDAPGENYAMLMRTHAYSDAYKTYKGDIKLPIMTMVIVVAVVLMAVVAFMFLRGFIGGESEQVLDSPPQIQQDDGIRPRSEDNGGY